METEQKPPESLNANFSSGTIALPGVGNSNLPKLPPVTATTSQGQEIFNQVTDFLVQLPEYLGSLYQQYSQSIINVLLILAAIVTAKVVLAILAAIHDIPVLSALFELVGISYSTWFVFRYLVKASSRQELSEQISLVKTQVFGK